jgi:hypothetical protein
MQYLYWPLEGENAIRLLELQPGRLKDQVVCHLVSTTIDASPPFEAFSYVWGSTEDKYKIQCDGNPFYVTANLESALSRLSFSLAGKGTHKVS